MEAAMTLVYSRELVREFFGSKSSADFDLD
jgi:hypothetical protein